MWKLPISTLLLVTFLAVSCSIDSEPACDTSCKGPKGGGGQGGSNEDDQDTGGSTNGPGGTSGNGQGGESIDPQRPVERALRYCPNHGLTPACEDSDAYYQFETFVGCGLRHFRRVDDLLEEDSYFVDLQTNEIIYRSTFTEDDRCFVSVDMSNGPPTCEEFEREPCPDPSP